ncbi:precorrin-6A/cobalt-precorrin-6A reductase [Cyanobium sp. NIES-981]|uniref:precorrin-6A/cobalt-precorrin-6A reductase n=1 Tax=Cyanobium sp. NIES-981 TaxID=1851505 RepID=UPI0012FA3604|nr:precorrin-6A/cobalt-precorrin-6A reductase [Cyanobium sp. NIES-981]
MFAGTGEGPGLAQQLQAQGWRLRVSVVDPAAGKPYEQLSAVEISVGALAGVGALRTALEEAEARSDPFALVIDATHPFAERIHTTLQQGCAASGTPLLRLSRPPCRLGPGCTVLPELAHLSSLDLSGRRLLLAIGARRLPEAVACTAGAVHHARLLPNAHSLQQAMAARLAPQRVACLRPTAEGSIEAALVRRWGIEVILVRQSGGEPERRWHRLAARHGCRLLLLQRPEPGSDVPALSGSELLRDLAQWRPPG